MCKPSAEPVSKGAGLICRVRKGTERAVLQARRSPVLSALSYGQEGHVTSQEGSSLSSEAGLREPVTAPKEGR